MYRIRFREQAAEEIDLARQYYFFERVHEWLKELAQEAAAGTTSMSGNFEEFLSTLDQLEQLSTGVANGHWAESFRRFRDATAMERLRALLVVLRQRRAPWQMAIAVTWFSNILETLDAEVHVFYEIDHVNRMIVVNKFTGLPGQGH